VRCLRLARELGGDVALYPQSPACMRFFEREGLGEQIVRDKRARFPRIVVTDLREPHGISAAIHAQGSLHVSIHDLGLAQCRSDVAIDGSPVQLLPFHREQYRALFLGTDYTISRPPVPRSAGCDTVLVTLGGGASAEKSAEVAEGLGPLGLRAAFTTGLGSEAPMPDAVLEAVMSRCLFAISASGTALYDLLASGIPTIAVALDPVQLRTADAFQEAGAALSAGLLPKLTPAALLARCRELLGNAPLMSRMAAAGRRAVDGRGLQRVVGILENLRREVWSMKPTATFSMR
jgi:hypothetical protein